MIEPSPAYLQAVEDAKRHHASAKTYSGKFLRPHKPWIAELVSELSIADALDYGAGKGIQYEWIDPEDGKTLEQAWDMPVTKYDPCWPPFATEPDRQFDLVICTHTLGSIPIVDQEWVLDRLYAFARKALYVAEKLGPVKKGVHGKRKGFPNFWTADQWADLLRTGKERNGSGAVVVLSTMYAAPDGQKITTRIRI